MLARRVIALSADKAFAKQLGTAMKAAGGAVEVHASLDGLGREIQAALVVVHLDGELADAIGPLVPRLAGDGRIIAVLPRSDLTRAIAVMQQSDRVVAVMIAEDLRPSDLSSLATRVLAGDIFGLEKLVPWGTKIYSQLVGDYQEKSLCIAQLSEFAELMGVRRKYREAIEQVVDEMLMNALYDAPVDEAGKQIFAEIPTKTRISLRMEQKVVVQYACDGRTFSVSVRDSFGTLDRGTVVRYIDKCLHSSEQIDRKTGGAGLGLYLMANSTTRMFFNVLPGVATEAVCTFDLDSPKVQLHTFGFFTERIDAAGRLAAGPSRLLPQGVSHPVERRRAPAAPARAPRAVIAALSAAIALLLVLIALVAYPRLSSRPTASLTIVTEPGATIEVEGKVRGVAESGTLVVAGLVAGRPYRVKATRPGFRPAETLAEADADAPGRIELPLLAEAATVTFRSDPDGATVIVDGEELGKTPLTVTSLTPRAQLTAVLRRPGYADDAVTLTVPGPGGEATIDLGGCDEVTLVDAGAKGGAAAIANPWAIELSAGLGGVRDDAFARRLEDFDYQAGPLRTSLSLGVVRRLAPHLAAFGRLTRIGGEHWSYDAELEPLGYDVTSHALTVGGRAELASRDDRTLLHAEAGAGVTWARERFEDEMDRVFHDDFFGAHLSAGAGFTRYPTWLGGVGLGVSARWIYAPTVDNDLPDPDTMDVGALFFGVTAAYRP